MGVSSAFIVLLVISLGVLQTLAEPDCQELCGTGGDCDQDGNCHCKKNWILIEDAKPHCQAVASPGAACKYHEQCSTADKLSRCDMKKNKCECYDTQTEGKAKVREYKGTCQMETKLGGKCYTNEQCKAFIAPEDYVQCYRHHEGANEGTCECQKGKTCSEIGNGVVGVHSGHAVVATIGLFIIAATKIIL